MYTAAAMPKDEVLQRLFIELILPRFISSHLDFLLHVVIT